MAENELWSGISIMSPEEMESSMGGETQVDNQKEGKEEIKKEEDGPSIVEPTSTEDREEFDKSVDPAKGDDKGKAADADEGSEENRQVELNKYGALIKDLQADGILSGLEGEELEEKLADASMDTIKELMETTVNESFKAKEKKWKEGFSGSKKRFLDIEDSFDDADYAIQMAQRLDYLDTLDEESVSGNVNLQKQLYAEHLRSKNFTDDEIRESLEEAEAIDKLEDKAKKALPSLRSQANNTVTKSKEQRQERQQKMAKQYETQYNTLMESIDSKEEFIPGLKLNKTIKDKIKDNITAPVHKDENGKELTSLMYKQARNPSEFQMLINYYDSIGLFNIGSDNSFKPDVSKLKNVAKSKAVNELDKVLSREESQGVGRRNSQSQSDKTGSALDLLTKAYGDKNKKR